MKIKELIEGDIVQGPWNKKPKAKKIPLYKAFGREEFILILEAGFKFDEKPSSFESIKNEINVRDINQIQKLIGRRLNTYKANEILASTEYPQQDANFQN